MSLGLALGFINTAAYSFAAQAYPEKVDKLIGLFEGMFGSGVALGPVFGSIVYEYFGFFWTFLGFGCLLASFGLLTCCLQSPQTIIAMRKAYDAEQRMRDSAAISAGEELDRAKSITPLIESEEVVTGSSQATDDDSLM